MKKVGLIVSKEYISVSEILANSPHKVEKCAHGAPFSVTYYPPYRKLNQKFAIYLCHCDIGELASAAATELLISSYKVDYVVNFGMAFPLNDLARRNKITVASGVVHYDFDVSHALGYEAIGVYPQYSSCYIEPDAKLIDKIAQSDLEVPFMRCASGDKCIVNPDSKPAKLCRSLYADICDMNSAGVAVIADRHSLPWIVIKGITDGVHNGNTCEDLEFDKSAARAFRYALLILNTMLT